MIQIRKRLIILTLFIVNISCSQKIREEIEYSADMSIDNFLYDHFPKEICTKEYKLDYYTNQHRNNVAIFLRYSNCDEKKDLLQNDFRKKSLITYNINDECLFYINETETLESLEDNRMVEESIDFSSKECNYLNKIPIPNLNMYFEGSASDYDIYVFEAKKGLYSEFYKFSQNLLMPSYWNHGYSKGVAFSRTTNEIIYWGCMW